MTTVVFRKNGNTAQIASDSRVTWINDKNNLPIKWFDSDAYLKTVTINDAMYGFAGTNAIYKIFLMQYKMVKQDSNAVLDMLVKLAQQERVQFSIIRYESEKLQLFSYSPANDKDNEVLRFSKDPHLPVSIYAIGSGKYSKQYKKNKINKNAKTPIYKIISANKTAFRKNNMLELNDKVEKEQLTIEESKKAYLACSKHGGDLFTGGNINMSQNITDSKIQSQIRILDNMDKQAKANNAVCASPINAKLEIEQLRKMGQCAVTKHKFDNTPRHNTLLQEMRTILKKTI